MNSLVSVIIPAYNASLWLGKTVESALEQSWPNVEVIIIDDGSSDHTLEIAKQYESSKVKVYSQANKGASAARNKGILHASGEFIQFLDADDLLHPDKIASQMKSLAGQADTLAYSSWGIFYEDIEKTISGNNALSKNYNYPHDWLIEAWTKGLWGPIFAWLTPKNIIEKAGPWNEEISLHDDGEFFCRVILQSQRIIFVEKSMGYYRRGNSSSLSSALNRKAALSHLEVCRLYEKNLLADVQSVSAVKAVAANYKKFIYFHYPNYPDLLKNAEDKVSFLGGSNVKPQGTLIFKLLKRIIGWKLARRVENKYYINGWNYSSLKDRIVKLVKH